MMAVMTNTKRLLTLILISGLAQSVALANENHFWQHWSDGKAEVNAYRVTQKRYSELRDGTIFLIYVTEPFSKSRHVKVDYYDQKNPDHTIALKLNIVERFQTGVYDYRLMTSHFFDAANGLDPEAEFLDAGHALSLRGLGGALGVDQATCAATVLAASSRIALTSSGMSFFASRICWAQSGCVSRM